MTSTRRSFLSQGSSALVALACAPSVITRRDDHDIVIRGGMVYDGSGAEGRVHDIAVDDGRITAIAGRILERGRDEIDARGQAVALGFIDIHSHADSSLADDWRAESVIRQGITTIVAGADGGSRATGADDRSFAELFATWNRLKPGCNVASMVGLGTLRGAVIGSDDRPAIPGLCQLPTAHRSTTQRERSTSERSHSRCLPSRRASCGNHPGCSP